MVYCGECNENVNYKVETREVKKFKGVDIDTFENVCICSKCYNELYVAKIEDENIERINKAYREKMNIISAKDIIEFREKYNISQRELTNILDFGKMTINRYENGAVPTKSQSDYLKILFNNHEEFLKKAYEAFEEKRINERVLKKIETLDSTKDIVNNIQNSYRELINNNLKGDADIYNGYKKFDLNKTENIISYIASKVENLTITSLNKYLWFIDSISLNERGIAITGLRYEHQKFGPTVINEKYKELSLLDDKYIRYDYEDESGSKTKIKSKKNYDLSELKDSEKEIINRVIKKFKCKNVTTISKLSHEEDGWVKTKNKELISFEYAKKLKILGEE